MHNNSFIATVCSACLNQEKYYMPTHRPDAPENLNLPTAKIIYSNQVTPLYLKN